MLSSEERSLKGASGRKEMFLQLISKIWPFIYFYYLWFQSMEILQNIFPKSSRGVRFSKDNFKLKQKHKKRSESLEAIFRLPNSVLDKFRSQPEAKHLKRERSRNQRMDQTVELGDIGQEYHQNLRRTILNQTKETLNVTKPLKTKHHQKNFMVYDDCNHNKPPISIEDTGYTYVSQYEKTLKTLSILQKTIIKEDNFFQVHQHLLQLQANRLPIIRKKEFKRKKMLQAFEEKQGQLVHPKRLTSRQKDHSLKSPLGKLRLIRQDKLQIRGWETPQYAQL